MNGYIPLGFIIIFVSLYYFYEINRVSRIQKDRKQEIRRNRQERMLNTTIDSKKKLKKNTKD